MAFYTKEDLLTRDRIFANRLPLMVLADFYQSYLIPNRYIFDLNNHERIDLIFKDEQCCHLFGLSYFGYEGRNGWLSISNKSITVANLKNIAKHKREEIRLVNVGKIITILDKPDIYIYRNNDLSYKSQYFAVYDDGTRYYKLGIGLGVNKIHYPETFQVSLKNSKDNQEIDSNNLIGIISKKVIKCR